MRSNWLQATSALAALLLAASRPALSQSERQALWFSGGISWAVRSGSCASGCPRADGEGNGLSAAIGIQVHRRAAVGAHLFHWMRSRDSSIAGAITTGLTYYPWSTRRWWLLASGGWSWYSVESDGIGFQAREVVRTDGPGVAVAVGFDLHLDREISLSPSLTWYRGWLPGLRGSRLRSSGLRQDVVSFAMALTFH